MTVATTTPTTQELADGIIANLSSALSQTIPLLPKSFSRVLAKAIAGSFIIIYKYAGFSHLQQYVRYASYRETTVNGRTLRPLVELGNLVGAGNPTPAVAAEHTVTITVLDQTGSLPAGTQLVRSETGVIYQTSAAVTLDAPTKSATIVAISDQDGNDGSGTLGNLAIGDIVEFANPLVKVGKEATVAAQTVAGANEESEESYRRRVQNRYRQPEQGGAYADYRAWAEEVAGIVYVYAYTGDPGEVDVYCEATEASSGSTDGIPTAAQLATIENSINLDDAGTGLATRRPANAAANVLPITRTAFDIEITNLVADNESQTKGLISDAVDEYLRAREPFIVGLSVLPKQDRITNDSVAGLVHEIAAAEGATVATVILKQGGGAVGAWTLGEGEKAKLGTVTYY